MGIGKFKMTILYLVRHGQTDYNLKRLCQGHADIPLNQTGILQAERLSKEIQDIPFAAAYSSDLSRALITATIITKALNVPLYPDQRLREIGMGSYEGVSYDDMIKNFVERYQGEDFENKKYPGGESIQDVASRVNAAIRLISAHHPDENVLVVAHGVSLSTLICSISNIPLYQVYDHIPKNGSPVIIDWQN